jgi:hypothetical protein
MSTVEKSRAASYGHWTFGERHTVESRDPRVISHPDIDRKMEPDLELWIDTSTTPVNVRLAGALDDRTGQSVRSIVEGLLSEGFRHFAMQVDGLPLPAPAGFSCLVGIQRLVKSAGGSMNWSRWPESRVASRPRS